MQSKSSNSRTEILNKISKSREERRNFNYPEPDWNENIYKEIEGTLEECFAKELAAVNGNCVLCNTEDEAFDNVKKILSDKDIDYLFCRTSSIKEKLEQHEIPFSDNPADFENMKAGITFCEALVARTGSVMVSAAHEAGRQMNIYPPTHIVLAQKSQLVPYVSDALAFMKSKYAGKLPSAITNITGPSRTSDIEKTLILGAHGPKDIWVIVY